MSKGTKELGELWFTPRQAAKKLGVGYDRILSWIHSGRLSAVDINKFEDSPRPHYRISETALQELMSSQSLEKPKKAERVRRRRKSKSRY